MINEQKLKEKIKDLSPIEAKKIISKETGLKKTATRDLYIKLKSDWGEEIEGIDSDVTYNKTSDCYILFLKKLGKNVVLKGDTYRDIVRCYSDLLGEPSTIEELSRIHAIPRNILTEILKICGLNHSILPISDEELKEKGIEELSEDILELKKFKVIQNFNKRDWAQTRSDATKWLEFQEGVFNPLKQFLEKWNPPEFKLIPSSKTKSNKNGRVFVCGAFDWHWGAKAEQRYLFRKKEWNCQKANEAISKYILKIEEEINNQKNGFEKIVLLLGGDLFDSVTGMTEKGTKLSCEVIRDTQFDGIFDSLTYFISQLIALFPSIEIHFVRGNHGGTSDYHLGKALKSYFRTEKRLEFNLHSARAAILRVKDVLLLLDHGASDLYHHKVPKGGKSREAYIQSLLLAHPEKLVGIKQKIFVQGDLHHFSQHEYNDFEFFMFGALPTGSQFSDSGNWNSRARQNCLIIGETGVESVLHYYLD